MDDNDDLVNEKTIHQVDDETQVQVTIPSASKQDSAGSKRNKGLIAPYEGNASEGKDEVEGTGSVDPIRVYFKVRRDILIFKGIVCSVLLGLVFLTVHVAIGRNLVPRVDDVFCLTDTEALDKEFCVLKSGAVVTSWLLLTPEIAMIGAQIHLLLFSTGKFLDEESGRIWRVRHKALGALKDFATDFFWGFQALYLPVVIVAIVSKFGFSTKLAIAFISLSLDALLTWSLFPLSYYVIGSSSSPSEIVINVVAVQFFAHLDDQLIMYVFRLCESAKVATELYYD
jgi:hypothetical protein